MDFSDALKVLKQGDKVARKGWNGRGMWLIIVPGSDGIKPNPDTPYHLAGITQKISINSHIDMYTSQGTMQPGWLASQSDILADDWVKIGTTSKPDLSVKNKPHDSKKWNLTGSDNANK